MDVDRPLLFYRSLQAHIPGFLFFLGVFREQLVQSVYEIFKII